MFKPSYNTHYSICCYWGGGGGGGGGGGVWSKYKLALPFRLQNTVGNLWAVRVISLRLCPRHCL